MARYKYLPALVLLLFLSGGQAAPGGIEKLMANLHDLDSFSADFSQRLIGAGTAVPEPSQGHMVFKYPGKFRWVYETPYEQEIISDGKTLWVFDKDLEQVTIRSADDDGLTGSPLTILDRPDSIAELYTVELLFEQAGEQKIRLTPKYKDAGFQSVVLAFADKKLVAMEIRDNFDQHSRLSFHNIRINLNPDEARFSFTPPADVDVIDATE